MAAADAADIDHGGQGRIHVETLDDHAAAMGADVIVAAQTQHGHAGIDGGAPFGFFRRQRCEDEFRHGASSSCGKAILDAMELGVKTPPTGTEHPMTTPTPLTPGWDDIALLCRTLAERLTPAGPYRGIVAVARGGMVPAGILAGLLGIKLIDTVCLTSYDSREQHGLTILKPLSGATLPQPAEDGEGWLAVDDLVDSGATARAVRAMLPKIHYATLYAKPRGRADVDTVAAETEQSRWVIFPWETD